MSKVKTIPFLLLVIFASTVFSGASEEVTNPTDQLCQMLFDTYLARQGMINTSTIKAASHIVAERGRDTGFWKIVLRELQSGHQESELGCVRVLGNMLAIDAAARDAIRREKETGQVGQWAATVCLGPEAVKEIITRGRAANRFRVDQYAIALLRARVPETADFFRMILRDDTGEHYLAGTKFHAAVGLAQLGEPDGFTWLFEHTEDPLDTVASPWPWFVSNLNLDTCSVAALRDLSGEKNLKSKQEWQSWWNKVDKSSLPKNLVRMVDP
jgi:hypothetical protein